MEFFPHLEEDEVLVSAWSSSAFVWEGLFAASHPRNNMNQRKKLKKKRKTIIFLVI